MLLTWLNSNRKLLSFAALFEGNSVQCFVCFFFNLPELLGLYLHMCSSGAKQYIARVYTHNFGLPFPVYFIFKTLCPTFQLLCLPWTLWSGFSNQGDHFSCDLSSSNIIQQGKAIGAFRLSFAIFYLEFIVLICRMARLRGDS